MARWLGSQAPVTMSASSSLASFWLGGAVSELTNFCVGDQPDEAAPSLTPVSQVIFLLLFFSYYFFGGTVQWNLTAYGRKHSGKSKKYSCHFQKGRSLANPDMRFCQWGEWESRFPIDSRICSLAPCGLHTRRQGPSRCSSCRSDKEAAAKASVTPLSGLISVC